MPLLSRSGKATYYTDNLACAADHLTRADQATVADSMGVQVPESFQQQDASRPAVTDQAIPQCLPQAELARRPVTGMQL